MDYVAGWYSHEEEYCVVVSERPPDADIFDITDSWASARHQIDGYEIENHDGCCSRLKAVKFQDDYFVVHCNSVEQEAKYLRQEAYD